MNSKRLGHYLIAEQIGAGGMGEVYRAHDERLGRDVAIKVLPEQLANDPEALSRFEREAKAVAALSHPNILAVYDIGRHADTAYLVMEMLEGETLGQRLASGPLPVGKAVQYALQLAQGLAATHERGIVHRDIKPANIFLTKDGHVKVMDFGLARHNLAGLNADDSASPTRLRHTIPGTLLGTPGYISPELVRGKEGDHRSDIFSLGCVLYEMLAGRRAFHGESALETLNAILKEDPPPLSDARAGIPSDLERIVFHCLEKRPEDRFQSARDLAFDLACLSGDSSRTVAVAALAPSSRVVHRIAFALLALLALAGAFVGGRQFERARRGESAGLVPASFLTLSDQPGVESWPSLAPDGKSVAYVARGAGSADVYLQRVGGGVALNLTPDSPAEDYEPAFSPNGERIAFRSEREGGGIFVMGATGESVRRLSDFGFAPSWSPDGKEIVVSTVGFVDPLNRAGEGELWAIDAVSGAKRPILLVGDAVQPHWSPHGWRVAYWGILPNRGGQRDLWTIAADGSEAKSGGVSVTEDRALDWSPVWSPDGRYLFFSSDRGGTMNLWRVPIEERSGRVLGEPEPVITPSSWSGEFSLSRDGDRLAFATLEWRSTLQKVPFDPARGVLTGPPQRFLSSTQPIRDHEVSPDGEWVVYTRTGTPEDVFVARTDGSTYRRLTDDAFRDRGPAWSPDGQRIAFYSDRGGTYNLWTIRADGSGLQELTRTTDSMNFPVWSPDGSRLAVSTAAGQSWFFVNPATPSGANAEGPMPAMADGSTFWPLSWSRDGAWLVGSRAAATGAFTGIVRYWLESRRYEVLYDNPRGGWLSCVALADGRHVLARDRDGIFLLDVASRQPKRLVAVTGHFVGTSVGVTRDQRWITFVETASEGNISLATFRR